MTVPPWFTTHGIPGWLILFGFALLVVIFVALAAPRGAPGSSPEAHLGTDRTPLGASLGQESGERPAPALVRSTVVEAGVASWYCCTRGYAGTAVVAIPGARYVPAGSEPWGWANVCAIEDGTSSCGTFPVVDACGCPGDRIVDLSIEAVGELGLDPDRGIWPAQVTILRDAPGLTLPPTEVGP